MTKMFLPFNVLDYSHGNGYDNDICVILTEDIFTIGGSSVKPIGLDLGSGCNVGSGCTVSGWGLLHVSIFSILIPLPVPEKPV
jgi:hypothetical protein